MQQLNVAVAVALVGVGFAACSGSEGGASPPRAAGAGGQAGELPGEAGAAALGEGGSSQAEAGGGSELRAGAAGQGAASGTCPAPTLLGADELRWQALPNLADEPDSEPDEPTIAIDAEGRIHVAAVLLGEGYALPARLEVRRLNGDSWELVGGEPVASQEMGILRTLGVAAVDDEVFVLFHMGVAEVKLMHSTGQGWSDWALDAPYAGFEPRRLESDALGRPLLLARAAGQAQVLVYGGAGFEPVGEPFDIGLPAGALMAQGEVALACNGLGAALLWPRLFTFDGQSWQSLGEVAPSADTYVSGLALGPDGKPVVSWRHFIDSDHDTIATVLVDPQTGEQEPLDGADAFQVGALYPVPAVDNANRAYLAWRINGPHVASAVDGSWQPFIGDGNPNGGQTADQNATFPALTLDRAGLPIVAWMGNAADGVSIGIARAVPR